MDWYYHLQTSLDFKWGLVLLFTNFFRLTGTTTIGFIAGLVLTFTNLFRLYSWTGTTIFKPLGFKWTGTTIYNPSWVL